jgi:mRNA interferase MazF
MAGRLSRGEVRLCRFALLDKERPVLILTDEPVLHVLSRVTVAPLTSTVRGVASEVVLGQQDGMRQPCAVNLHNLVTVDQTAVGRRLTQLSRERMVEVCHALAVALGCMG